MATFSNRLAVFLLTCTLGPLLATPVVAQAILDTEMFDGHTYHLVGGDASGAGIS